MDHHVNISHGITARLRIPHIPQHPLHGGPPPCERPLFRLIPRQHPYMRGVLEQRQVEAGGGAQIG